MAMTEMPALKPAVSVVDFGSGVTETTGTDEFAGAAEALELGALVELAIELEAALVVFAA
jgi:hypothetical protein